jgi:hypothetical protein
MEINIYFCLMKKSGLLALFSIVTIMGSLAQIKGCTDPQASNYDAQAEENNGSCVYPKSTIIPSVVCPKLHDSLIESSGLIYFNNWFWTHNDSDNPPMIFAFDSSSGAIIHTTYISNKVNTDWEDMTQDADHIYIGDFGNNSGNRLDLKILVIKKADLQLQKTLDTVTATEINFSLADQTLFNHTNQNHDFDLEALCFFGDSLHLFSKNWVDKKTRHYVVSRLPGTYTLSPQESFLVDGQITGAAADHQRGIIVLTGYNKSDISSFLWLFWDFKGNRFSKGNKRRIETGTVASYGQGEAVCFKGKQIYLSNEKYLTEASLKRVEIETLLSGKPLSQNTIIGTKTRFTAWQSQNQLIVRTESLGKTLLIYNSDGKLLRTVVLDKAETSISTEDFMDGLLLLKVDETVLKVYVRQ